MAGRSGLGHSCHLRNRAPRLIPAGAAGEEPAWGRPARPQEGPGGVPVVFRPGVVCREGWGPGPAGAPLCAPRGRPLRFRNRRTGATSSERPPSVRLASPLRPVGPASHPRTPSSPGSPSAKKKPRPHRVSAFKRKLRLRQGVGLVQGHSVDQTSPGKCIPPAASD